MKTKENTRCRVRTSTSVRSLRLTARGPIWVSGPGPRLTCKGFVTGCFLWLFCSCFVFLALLLREPCPVLEPMLQRTLSRLFVVLSNSLVLHGPASSRVISHSCLSSGMSSSDFQQGSKYVSKYQNITKIRTRITNFLPKIDVMLASSKINT